jgi:hypothetical protein
VFFLKNLYFYPIFGQTLGFAPTFVQNFIKMNIEISLNNPNKLAALIELLSSLNYVDYFKVVENEQTPSVASEPFEPIYKNKQLSFTQRFYGSAKTGLTMEEVDAGLNELRTEWERDTF